MREILFRIWNGTSYEYDVMVGKFGAFYVNPMNDGLDVDDSASLSPFNTKFSDDVVIEQFTGLVDSNGKRVFEGDILLTNGMDGKLLWVSYFDDETAQFDFCPLGHEYCSTHNELYYSSKRQIIGNIHDNPEVMGVEK